MSWSDRRLLLEVAAGLALARLLVWIIPIHLIIRFINLSFMQQSGFISSANRKQTCDIRHIGHIICQASRYTPWRSKCLEQAIVGLLLLRYRGIICTLYLGLAKDNNRLIAHAWLCYDDIIITGADGRERFVPIYVSGDVGV